LLFEPGCEHPEDGEAETTRALIETLGKIQGIVEQDSGHAERAVHAKSHGILVGELEVFEGLPVTLAQGLFAEPRRYPVVMRFSTVPGDILDDRVSTPRGLAIKIVGVEGARLPGTEGATTQDFVLVNGPAFGKPTAKAFLGTLKQLGATTDKAPGAKQVLSTVTRAAEHVVEAFGGASPTLLTLGGQPKTNLLGETYYTQTPLLYGLYMAKLCAVPSSPELQALIHAPVDLKDKPNGLREAVVEFFRSHGAEWELRVQLCTDLETMPIEDASKVWPEDESPYVGVARIRVRPQLAWTPERYQVVEEAMSFSPWHGLAAHRPLGSVNRVRKTVYDQGAARRAQSNGRTVSEPTSLDHLFVG
jgi:hypothetical protein